MTTNDDAFITWERHHYDDAREGEKCFMSHTWDGCLSWVTVDKSDDLTPLHRSQFHWKPAIDYSAGSLAIIFRTARQFFSCRSAIEFRLLIELHLMLGSYWICIDYSPFQPRHSSWSSPRGVLVYLRFYTSFHLLHKLTKRIRRKIPWAWKAGDFKRTATSEIENFHRHSNRFTKHRM